MDAIIKEVNIEDNLSSDLVPAIVLEVGKDDFYANWVALEKAGFILRNWEDDTIIVYAKKYKIK